MFVALLTDFGTRDHYVASMKGVMAGILPNVSFIDITHEIPPGGIEAAAFALFACFRDIPSGAVILAVVDPGVGSRRRAIAALADGKYLVGPDNGIFSYIFDICPEFTVFSIGKEMSAARKASATFHGRDIFAPTAANLARRMPIKDIGPPITDPVRLQCIYPVKESERFIGRVLHVDRFGNVITNVPRGELGGTIRAEVKGTAIFSERSHYAEALPGELFVIEGSLGLVEISKNGESAAAELGLAVGDEVLLISSGA